MVTLRTRLRIGYSYIMLLVLLTAGSAAIGFYQISNAIDRILSENFRSVDAAVEMLEALEEQNTLSMRVLLEDEPPLHELRGADEVFTTALDAARGNIVLEGEVQIIAHIEANYQAYLKQRAKIFTGYHEQPFVVFNTELFPNYLHIKESVFSLLNLNHDAIIAAEKNARATALQTAAWLGLLVTIVLISMAVLARVLQRKIISRLQDLAEVAQEISVGNHSRRFDARQNDELGTVARQLNNALDARDELQAEMRGRINQEKQLVLGLLEDYGQPGLLIGLDSKVIAITDDVSESTDIDAIMLWLRENRRVLLENFRATQKLTVDEHPFAGEQVTRIQLLTTAKTRPVGWLITMDAADAAVSAES